MKLVLFLFVCTTYVCAKTANYCKASLCSGSKHIACKNTGAYATTCASDRIMMSITPFKDMIVRMHNTYRNRIANGQLPGFKPASRMATMVWDNELAALAKLNTKRCVMKHDACRNTDRFKFSGQNLAWRWGIPAPTVKQTIIVGIDGWFNEYKDATQAYIDKFRSSPKVIGHFTAMVNAKATRIGCALLRQSKNNGKEYFFACNYSQTNILNYPIYVSGPAASKCTKGKNSQFPGLCAVTEPINPNQL